MRGRRCNSCLFTGTFGNTPAYAGKTPLRPSCRRTGGKHPRVCGEDLKESDFKNSDLETPPRMRGRPVYGPRMVRHSGNTPAYAGKTVSAAARITIREKHPRVCGEDSLWRWGRARPRETPPRMRGRHPRISATSSVSRNTPAYAGKTSFLRQ